MSTKQTKLLFEGWRKFLKEEDVLANKKSWDSVAQNLSNVAKEPYEKFVTDLQKLSADPKVAAILKYGQKDGTPNDEKVKSTEAAYPVQQLKPTQNEIALDKSLGGPYGPLENPKVAGICLAGGEVLVPSKDGKPIVTGAGGTLVLDGHHRWSMLFCCDKDAKVKSINLDVAGLKPSDYLKIVQMAIVASSANLPSATAKGSVNLITVDENTLKQYVIKNLKPEALKIWAEKGKGKTPQEVANYIWGNIQVMQKTGVPVPGAPKRDVMPQTDMAPKAIDYLKAGAVNYKNIASGEYPGKGKAQGQTTAAGSVKESKIDEMISKIIFEELKKIKSK